MTSRLLESRGDGSSEGRAKVIIATIDRGARARVPEQPLDRKLASVAIAPVDLEGLGARGD